MKHDYFSNLFVKYLYHDIESSEKCLVESLKVDSEEYLSLSEAKASLPKVLFQPREEIVDVLCLYAKTV